MPLGLFGISKTSGSLWLQVFKYYLLWALKYIYIYVYMTYLGLFGAPGVLRALGWSGPSR